MIRLVVSDNDMISLSTVVIRDDEVIPHMKDRRCKRSSYALSSTQLWDSHGILLSSQGISNHCFPHPSNIHQTSIEQQTAAFLRPFLLKSGMSRPALTSPQAQALDSDSQLCGPPVTHCAHVAWRKNPKMLGATDGINPTFWPKYWLVKLQCHLETDMVLGIRLYHAGSGMHSFFQPQRVRALATIVCEHSYSCPSGTCVEV